MNVTTPVLVSKVWYGNACDHYGNDVYVLWITSPMDTDGGHQIVDGDIIRAERYDNDGRQVYTSQCVVLTSNPTFITVNHARYATAVPQEGMQFVRIGSTKGVILE